VSGKVDKFILPGGMGVRVDTHLFQGAMVSPNYDSMVAKLIVHRPTTRRSDNNNETRIERIPRCAD
jgi:acetyl/propionyl-CoA carboxylase alpha subunit